MKELGLNLFFYCSTNLRFKENRIFRFSFKVIHAIGLRLPLALSDTSGGMLERSKNKSTYWPFGHIELNVPKIFMGIYILLLLSVVP